MRGDFAGGVSSNSSNLAWGGIKYLESREFLLVNKLCRSRNELMRAYPSTVKRNPLLHHDPEGLSCLVLVRVSRQRALLADRPLPDPGAALPVAATIEALEPEINTSNAAGGLEYSDCYLYDNDARFVFGFIRKALDMGCDAVNYLPRPGPSDAMDSGTAGAVDVESGRELSSCAPAPWSTPADPGPTSSTPARYQHPLPPPVFQGHPPDRRPGDRQPPRADLLRQRRSPVLPDSHGPEDLHRHHRHAGEDPRSASPTRTGSSYWTTSTRSWTCASRSAPRM
jgi:hypothetical protein